MIGHQVGRWRVIVGLTQQQLADRVGVTQGYVSLLESGRKPVTRSDLLHRLAEALGVSVSDLTCQPFEPDTEPGYAALFAAVPRIRTALAGRDEPVIARPPDELLAAADTALALWRACRFVELGAMLPDLLAESLASSTVDGADGRALSAAVKALLVGRGVLQYRGWIDLAAVLAERSTTIAAQLDDPVHTAAAAFSLGSVALGAGAKRRALDLSTEALDALPVVDDASRCWAAMLHHRAAFAAARCNLDPGPYLGEAAELSASIGGDPWRMGVQPTEVAVWSIGVALECGEAGRVPEIARAVDRSKLRSTHARASMLMYLGRGLHAAGRPDDAVATLLECDAVSPAMVRSWAEVREVVAAMVREAPVRGGSSALRELAQRCRISETEVEKATPWTERF